MGEYTNKIIGKTKKAVGRATGNRSLEGRGRLQYAGGRVQGGAKSVGRRVGRAVERGVDRVERSRAKRVGTRGLASRGTRASPARSVRPSRGRALRRM